MHIVVRERSTGSTYGVKCKRKGPSDEWVVRRIVETIDSWGLKNFVIWVKHDCEPSIRALQAAVRDARPAGTHLANSPARDPQANGVAERAVREYMSVLRRIKIGLEARLHCRVDSEHPIVEWISEHASFIINHCLAGTQDGFTAYRRMYNQEYDGKVVEFWEAV